MKSIAFRFSKEYFPDAFLEHPSCSKSDWFFISENSSIGQACVVNVAKRRLAFPFSSFPFPVFSHRLSPFFSLQGTVLWFFTYLFNFGQSPILWAGPWGVSRRRMRLFFLLVISQDFRFNYWLPGPCSASHMVFYPLCSVVSDSSLGRRWPVQGKKSFQIDKPAG